MFSHRPCLLSTSKAILRLTEERFAAGGHRRLTSLRRQRNAGRQWTTSRQLSTTTRQRQSLQKSQRDGFEGRHAPPRSSRTVIASSIGIAGLAAGVATQNRDDSEDSNNSNDNEKDEDEQEDEDEQSTSDSDSTLISFDEIQKHVSADDCWVIIKGSVYDVTDFLKIHPGGEHAILAKAGKDATETFDLLHPPGVLGTLPEECLLGRVDPDTLPAEEEKVVTDEELARELARQEMPAAQNMLLLNDFEHWAQRVLSETAWAYYRSAADEERTFFENRDAFQRYFFRPRILRDTSTGSTESSILGIPTAMPVFISPAAMAKLGHPLGEINLTKAAGNCNIVQMISCNASCSIEEMVDSTVDGQSLFFQIYLNKDRSASEQLLRKVEQLGVKAIVFTVDVCWQSKRTLDVRTKAKSNTAPPSPPSSSSSSASGSGSKALSVSQQISGYQDTNLTWDDISFIRRHTTLPIIVKGVQSLEDVQLCVDAGVEAVILSNHGGRQADYAPAPIDVLYEIRALRPDLFSKTEIMIDGGVRSGADVVKALALGAKAVGLGRPVLYANGTHGEEGVYRVMEIMQEEITNTMRNIGVTRIQDLRPEMVGPRGPWVGLNRPAYLPTV
ncbi:hypothetical protein BU24DRAFT_493107 [Aaosphaeria arxii CBS 175.79]|uniref:L-lactate dehydrogenase (cytochrome) n=1 Tax=Aaosphaeria arxii CBS 175.79 TaxID=1450172 RepID=A0A6A5XMP0_9PLEO|nr:uncharacterized protein BU24DRAFT_493107 [Aaosphaeria arxii CBS 175.79]KAF2014515.1 hypothetical protein BU24DRAFT_493107 [Aaosphaeria arxii CBS 175.79]